jgi:hypothetical protein
MQPYNNRLRQQRKLMTRQLGSTEAIGKFQHSIILEARRFLLRTLKDPEGMLEHVKM